MKKEKSTRGIPRRAGKRAAKIAAYYQLHYPMNKLRKILRINGERPAWAWAKAHGAEAIFTRLRNRMSQTAWWKRREAKGSDPRACKRPATDKEVAESIKTSLSQNAEIWGRLANS